MLCVARSISFFRSQLSDNLDSFLSAVTIFFSSIPYVHPLTLFHSVACSLYFCFPLICVHRKLHIVVVVVLWKKLLRKWTHLRLWMQCVTGLETGSSFPLKLEWTLGKKYFIEGNWDKIAARMQQETFRCTARVRRGQKMSEQSV